MNTFTKGELKTLLENEPIKLVDKVFLLANGMIKVYGYSKEKAFRQSVPIARDWFEKL
ncbi:hypothetical protein [Cytophaga sp. FL35]|uniref:hypothetical protein n=1 Tax=Cytophaga sp. FL35 TaxID=1904456 RepID=UPI001653996F|nr:hypothetical protein [Cytophaga sp. FL35]MBC6999423.1 hypothetical protein [Cytophaga sp. FL35]